MRKQPFCHYESNYNFSMPLHPWQAPGPGRLLGPTAGGWACMRWLGGWMRGPDPHGRRSSRKPLRRPCPRELRAFSSCMAWRAIPGSLSKRKRKLALMLGGIGGRRRRGRQRMRWLDGITDSMDVQPGLPRTLCQSDLGGESGGEVPGILTAP